MPSANTSISPSPRDRLAKADPELIAADGQRSAAKFYAPEEKVAGLAAQYRRR